MQPVDLIGWYVHCLIRKWPVQPVYFIVWYVEMKFQVISAGPVVVCGKAGILFKSYISL